MNNFSEIAQSLPTKFDVTRAVDDSMQEMNKMHNGCSNKGKVFFTNEKLTRRYDRLNYLKALLTRMTDEQFSQLQKVQWVFEKQSNLEQKTMF